MIDFSDIKKLLTPLIKGSPLIIICCIIGVLLVKKSIPYLTPTYESTAIIKIDDKNVGIADAALYKDFDIFSTSHKIATEVEVLKSLELLENAVKEKGLELNLTRIGKIKDSPIWNDAPILIEYTILDSALYNHPIEIEIKSDTSFHLSSGKLGSDSTGILGRWMPLEGIQLKIDKNEELIAERETIDYTGKFRFKIQTPHQIAKDIKSNGLDIMAKDKDVPIIRISYSSPIAEKTNAIVNAIAEEYVSDQVSQKKKAAGSTIGFLDKQIAGVEKKLQGAEKKLEEYKLNNKIIDLDIQSETDLRKIAQLELQLDNISMNEAAMTELNNYMKDGRIFSQSAPQSGFGDLLYTEMVKKLQSYYSEKNELLKSLQPQHPDIIALDNNIQEISEYISNSISNTKKDMKTRYNNIQAAIESHQERIAGMPSQQRQLVVLERDFRHYNDTYNFLTEKRMDAAIAEASSISFHRILQYGETPKEAVSPNGKFLCIIGGFAGFLLGCLLAYLLHILFAGFSDSESIKALLPLDALTKDLAKNANFNTIIQEIASSKKKQGNTIAFIPLKEDKFSDSSFLGLAEALVDSGYKTLAIDLLDRENSNGKGLLSVLNRKNSIKNTLIKKEKFDLLKNTGTSSSRLDLHKNFSSLLKEAQLDYDCILVQFPQLSMTNSLRPTAKLFSHHVLLGSGNKLKKKELGLLESELEKKPRKVILSLRKPTSLFSKLTNGGFYKKSPSKHASYKALAK